MERISFLKSCLLLVQTSPANSYDYNGPVQFLQAPKVFLGKKAAGFQIVGLH